MSLIGIFDSGLGGISVLEQLRRVAPACDFLYVADHEFCPYGRRPPQQILSRAVLIAKFLQRSGAEKIVIACNTASVFAREIRFVTKLPVLDVITPTCNAVIRNNFQKVALLATCVTIQSGEYQQKLKGCGVETVCFDCSALVPLVENGATGEQHLRTVADCLHSLPDSHAEAVILGCTHFPFIAETISAFSGSAQTVSCTLPVAEEFARGGNLEGQGVVQCLTTGNAQRVNSVAQKFGYAFTHVDI